MNLSTINRDLIRNISTYYNFTEVSVVKKLGGLGASNFIIKAGFSHYFLKLYDHCDQSKINNLNAMTRFLSSKDIPVILPINNKDGLFYTSVDNITFSLYPRIYDNIPGKLTPKSLASIACIISNFHNLGQECPLQLSHTIDTIKPVPQLINKLKEVDNLINQQQLNDSIKYLSQELMMIKIDILSRFELESLKLPESGKKSLVHGDFHIENLLFNSAQQVAYILDFDCVHFGYGIEDIMLFIIYRLFNTHYAKHAFEDAQHLLTLYSTHCPLDNSEIIFGVNYSLFKLTSSTFLEEKLCKTKDLSLAKHFDWSLKNIRYLQDNTTQIINQLIN